MARGTKVFRPGLTPLVFRDFAGRAGIRRYSIEVAPSKDDPCHGNNSASMLVKVEGRRPLLYLTDEPEASAAEVERLKKQVDIAAILGCSVMRHDVCYSVGKTGTSRSFGLMLPTIAANTRAVTEYAATKGIKTCTENHGYIAQDSYRVEQLFNAVAHDNYGLLVDVGNFVCADEDNCAAVSRVAPYAVHVHAKDMYKSATPAPGFGQTRGCNYFKGAIVGEGDVNVEKCLQILKRAGYDGYCSIEFEGSEDCIEGIAKGFENLKGMLERI